MRENIKLLKEKLYYRYGFGIYFKEAVTGDDTLIKGFNLYLFGNKWATFAQSSTDWVNNDGEPYVFKLHGNVLFIKKVAISIGNGGA